MVAKKGHTCPGCGKVLKSSSGWTLHVKKCCPELRWRKTTVKMQVEFEIPDVIHSDDPNILFRLAFYEHDVKGIGSCHLKTAALLDKTIDVRKPTSQEKTRMDRAIAAKDKNSTVREIKKIVEGIIGKPTKKQSIHTETSWPETVRITYTTASTKWDKGYLWDVAFTFNLKNGQVEVKQKTERAPGHSQWSREVIGGYRKVFRLADPDCIEEIREYTGLRP